MRSNVSTSSTSKRGRDLADNPVAGATIQSARRIVEEEGGRFGAWMEAAQGDPTIPALRLQAEDSRHPKSNVYSRLSDLDEREWSTPGTQRIVTWG